MKIVIATGIYPPEIGGPSFYAAGLKEALERQGHEVRVVLFGALKRFPSGIRHALYAIKLFFKSYSCNAIVALDTYSVGMPAALVRVVTGRRLIVRVGGDFVWEMYIERSRDLLPLPEFYAHRERWDTKELIAYKIIRWVMRHAQIVFSSEWQKNIWKDAYAVHGSSVIENAIAERLPSIKPDRKNFIFYTRAIALKNAELFRKAFEQAKIKYPEISLDEGSVPHEELMSRTRSCYAVVLPSISDITPNYILDGLRAGKPFLLTKYSGYAEPFKEYGVIVDPLSVDDMARGIERLADDMEYVHFKDKIAQFNTVRTYDDIARDFLSLIR